jgi:hypothetical protein
MKPHWRYIQFPSNAGLSRKPPRFKDLGVHNIKTFVRELIQNCIDARYNENEKVGIKIIIKQWGKKEISEFLKLLGEDHIELVKKSYAEALPEVKIHMKEGYELICGNKESTFCLVVEEANCVGLTGSVIGANEKSHFNALVRQTDNNENKKELSNSGGTWGKGSSIFTYISNMWTWFCYTKLSEPWHDREVNVTHEKRFMGRCMLAPFYDKANKYSYWGDGWYCQPETDAFPYINNTADEMASLFGLNERTEPGCSFLIPFLNPSFDSWERMLDEPTKENVFEEFRSQILQNWFIPIYNDLLKIELENENGNIKIDKDYLLREVPELKFKLSILNWYNEGCPPDKQFTRETIEVDVPAFQKNLITDFNRFAAEKERIKLDLIIRILSEDEDYENTWRTKNAVALTRGKGMIVTHYEDATRFLEHSTDVRTESILFAGLLSLSETDENKRKHLDLFLGYSENPPHNNWAASDKDLSYLEFFEGKRPDKTVRDIFDGIFRAFKKIFEEEKAQPTNKDICSIFKKLARLKTSGDEGTGKALYFMRTPDGVTNPEIIDGRYNYEFKFVHSESQAENVRVDFKSYIDSLEGETNKDFHNLGIPDFETIQLFDKTGNQISTGSNPSILLSYGDSVTVRIRTCNIDSNSRFKNLKPMIKTSGKTEPTA